MLAAGLGETEPICCSCGSQLPGSGSGWSLGPGILGSEAPSISPVSVVTSRAVNTRGLAHVTRDNGALEHYIGDLCNSQHGWEIAKYWRNLDILLWISNLFRYSVESIFSLNFS